MRKDVTNSHQKHNEMANTRRAGFFSPWANDYWDPGRWMDNFFSSDLSVFPSDDRFLSLAMDIDETAEEYLVSTDLPGVKNSDISIDCSGNQLTITAERKTDTGADRKHGRRERFFGTYQRSFTLPAGVDAEKIAADYDGGVLTVHIPKGEGVKSKRIQIASKSTSQDQKH